MDKSVFTTCKKMNLLEVDYIKDVKKLKFQFTKQLNLNPCSSAAEHVAQTSQYNSWSKRRKAASTIKWLIYFTSWPTIIQAGHKLEHALVSLWISLYKCPPCGNSAKVREMKNAGRRRKTGEGKAVQLCSNPTFPAQPVIQWLRPSSVVK